MAQFFTFTPKRKEDGAIDFYTLMDVFDERKEDGTTSPAGHGERKIKFNDMKVLIATEKPFAKKAVDGIKKIITDAGYEVALLEKYTDKAQLLAAVADANALIIRSDKVTAEVIEAAKNLKIVVLAGAGYDNVDLSACCSIHSNVSHCFKIIQILINSNHCHIVYRTKTSFTRCYCFNAYRFIMI